MAIFCVNLDFQYVSILYFIGAKDDGDGDDCWSYKICKVQSNHKHQQINTLLFIDWMLLLSPNQQCQSTEGWTSVISVITYISNTFKNHGLFSLHINMSVEPASPLLYVRVLHPDSDCDVL